VEDSGRLSGGARSAQNTATPLVLEDSGISRVIRQMSRRHAVAPNAGKEEAVQFIQG
jgi:hypothetical protein